MGRHAAFKLPNIMVHLVNKTAEGGDSIHLIIKTMRFNVTDQTKPTSTIYIYTKHMVCITI